MRFQHAPTALAMAPAMTIGGEIGLGVCLLLRSRTARRLGIVLAAVLHYAICVTPYPNTVPTFGVFCVVRLFVIMPEAWTMAITEGVAGLTTLPVSFSALAMRLGALALIAGSAACTTTPGIRVDWAIPTQTALCILGSRAVAIDINHRGFPSSGKDAAASGTRMALMRVSGYTMVLMAFFYVFGFQLLGLMDISATSPFSSIREHGGSNHLLMPTSLLFRSQTAKAVDDRFAGGVVRVTSCTSDHMNSLYPSNCTEELLPSIVSMLRENGHVGLQFNPSVRRMLGPEIRRFLPHWTPESKLPFPAYTLPALELRRLLTEARELNESFRITYDRLPGDVGDESWRRTAIASQVILDEDGKGGRRCQSRPAGAWLWRQCADDEIAMQPPPYGGILMKLLVSFPYAVIDDLDGLPCMD